ncbi:MAG: hypothetical protein PHC45_01175 [Clostridiaceae bacterium]|nr:hypothetical protein [Clostridiaceae bacterium]
MEMHKLEGTIVFFGCPAEEVLTGKVFMARAGAFNNIDCALNFHPGATNAELMNVGANYLREHIPSTVKVPSHTILAI